MTRTALLDDILKEMIDRKTENIACYYIAPKSSISDYIVIGTATSEPHVNAIAEYVLEKMKEKSIRPFAVEGQGRSRWICLDFGEVMVHLMCRDERQYYNLESIWGGCDKVEIPYD